MPMYLGSNYISDIGVLFDSGSSSGEGSGTWEVIVSGNLHDSSTDVANVYIKGSTETAYNGWSATDYIEVKSDTLYLVRGTFPGNNYNAFYQQDYSVSSGYFNIPSVPTDGYAIIRSPSDAAYLRMSAATAQVTGIELYELANQMPAGNITITANGISTVSQYETVTVAVPTDSSSSIALQQKTVSPTTSVQTVTADSGYDGLESVTVSAIATTALAAPTISVSSNGLITATENQTTSGYIESTTKTATKQLSTLGTTTYTPSETAQTISSGKYLTGDQTISAISSTYVGSGIDRNDSADLTVSGATVTAPAGYYETAVSKSVASGAMGTPTATKGTVSNHTVTVTPSVTNTVGYIAGGTVNGSGVSVSASELVSGNLAITENGTGIDVTNYETVSVNVESSGGTLHTVVIRLFGSPAGWSGIDEDAWFVYEENNYYSGITVDSGDTVRFCIFRDNYNIERISLSGNTIYQSGSIDLFTHDGYYYYDISNVQSDLDVCIYYFPGSATTPATTITANPSISVNSSGLITATASASQNVTPTVSEGYVSSGTAGTITVSGSNTQQLTTLGATTYTPSETAQTIQSGQYLTGIQTISAISSTYVGSGITRQTALSASGATVTAPAGYYESAVSATVSGQNYYSGSSAPSSSLGSNGDIYLQTS